MRQKLKSLYASSVELLYLLLLVFDEVVEMVVTVQVEEVLAVVFEIIVGAVLTGLVVVVLVVAELVLFLELAEVPVIT